MADQRDEFDVLIKTTGDTSGSEKVKASIAEVDAEAQAVNRRAPGATVPIDRANINASLDREAATREAILATETESNVVEEARIAAEARRNSLIQQREALIASEVELLQLEAAGETHHAAALASEIAEQRAALQIQQSTNLSEAESLALARQKIAAEEAITTAKIAQAEAAAVAAAEANAGNLLAGASLGKARQEATVLARELASGTGTTRTLSSLLGSLGPAMLPFLAGIYAAYQGLKGVNEATQAIGESLGEGNAAGLLKEVEAAEKLNRLIRDINEQSLDQQAKSVQSLGDKIQDLTAKYREAVVAHDGLLEPFTQANAKIVADLREQLSLLEAERQLRQLTLTINQAEASIEEQKTAELHRQQVARKEEIALQTEGFRLDAIFRQARDAGLSDADKAGRYRTELAKIQDALEKVGGSAKTAADAFQKSFDPKIPEADRNEIKKLATEWQNLAAAQKKEAIERGAAITKRGEESIAIDKQVEVLRAKHEALLIEIADETTTADRRKIAIEQARSLEQLIAKLLETQSTAPTADQQGLQKWLIDTAKAAGLSTDQLGNMLGAINAVYSAQSRAPALPVQANGSTNPAWSPGGPIIVAPAGPGLSHGGDPFWLGQRERIGESGFTTGVTPSGSTGFNSAGVQNVRKEAETVQVVITEMGNATASGFKDLGTEVKNMHAQLTREIEATKSGIAALWRAV